LRIDNQSAPKVIGDMKIGIELLMDW
jgi:hypothetical protein